MASSNSTYGVMASTSLWFFLKSYFYSFHSPLIIFFPFAIEAFVMVKLCNKTEKKPETEVVEFYGCVSKNYEGNLEKYIEANQGKNVCQIIV